MRITSRSRSTSGPRFGALAVALCAMLCSPAVARAEPAAAVVPHDAASPAAANPAAAESLPEIGHVRAVTPFCRLIVDHGSALATAQLADIRTTTEVLRILAYAPFDRDIFTEHRAAHALEILSDRLMASRRGEAQAHVAGLRTAAHGDDGDAPRPDLARFAGALDGAHSESSRVAHEISSALAVLDTNGLAVGGVYLPDYQTAHDPRLARAEAAVPFPVDADLERFPADRMVANGPLHAYARSVAFVVAYSLERMLDSVREAGRAYPAAFAGCNEVDAHPDAAASPQPAASP